MSKEFPSYTETVEAHRKLMSDTCSTPKHQEIKQFEAGVIIAAVNIVHLHDRPEIAADVLRDAGLSSFDARNYSEYDKESFRKINQEHGINITGLR